MPQRNSNDREQPAPTTLRRSPRLLQNNHREPADPKTPKLRSRKTNRVIHPDPTSLNSTQKVSQKKTLNSCQEKALNKVKESHDRSKRSAKLNSGSSISVTLNGRVDGFCCLRRSPRLSGKGNAAVGCVEGSVKGFGASDSINVEVQADLHRVSLDKAPKRTTRSFNKSNVKECVAKAGNVESNASMPPTSSGLLRKEVSSDGGSAKVRANSCEQFASPLRKMISRRSMASFAATVSGGERKERAIDREREEIGVQKRTNQIEEGHGIVQGWTEDQELALQIAYLAAQPTPHFWKNVAKLVPGKTAQDCFDKVHSDHLTPPQPRPRLRVRRTNSSSPSISASKLLTSLEPKIRKTRCSKRKSHLAQRTVRQLLEKQYHVDQDCEADLFSVLESTLSPCTQALQQGVALSTPACGLEKLGCFGKNCERSSSAHKKHFSHLSGSCGANLVSPPVLKQVKNKALHEKYLDQLHCREAKRNAASSWATKSIQGKDGGKESYNQQIDAINTAKNAVVLGARDIISRYQNLKANATSNFAEVDDVDSNDADEGDDVL